MEIEITWKFLLLPDGGQGTTYWCGRAHNVKLNLSIILETYISITKMDFGSFLMRAAVSLFILYDPTLCFPLKPAINIYQDKAENKIGQSIGAKT